MLVIGGKGKMKMTVVVDNTGNGTLCGEWGLCIYIEYNGKKILLDTGNSDLFAENAEALGIDLSQVDIAALSHAHSDHANGMERFFQINDRAKFYVQNNTAENCYFKYWIFSRYIGIPKGIFRKYGDRIVSAKGLTEISPGVFLLGHSTEGLDAIGRKNMMYQKRDGKWYPDDFSHEQSLIFDTEKGLVIFNSCSHGGAAAIIKETQAALPGKRVNALIGGFHLYKTKEADVRKLAADIKATGIEYICTGHCSGEKAIAILKEELGDMVGQLQVGLEKEF